MTPDKREAPTGSGGAPQQHTSGEDAQPNGSMSKREAKELAHALADKGFHVFPITIERKPDGTLDKDTITDHGHLGATTDHDEIDKQFRRTPRAGKEWGVAVYPHPSGYMVVDVDIKKGGRGLESLAEIEAKHGKLPGRRVRTPSGGFHIWMRVPPSVTIGQSQIWEGIDLRSDRGWVVAPGVRTPWGSWDPEPGSHADAPKALIDEIVNGEKEAEPLPSDPGVGDRHPTLMSFAATLRNKFDSADRILHQLRAFNESLDAPKPDDELKDMVTWVMSKEGPPPDPSTDTPRGAGDYHESIGLIDWEKFFTAEREGDDWLIAPIVPRSRLTALYAQAGEGKSELVLEKCVTAATKNGLTVVYLDFEMTEDDVYDRLIEMGYDDPEALAGLHYYLLPDLPKMDTAEGGEAVLEIAQHHDADLVVVDTVSRTLSGKENDSDTFRDWNHHTGQPLKRDGRSVLRTDHAGKDPTKGQRGTSAKNDDADVIWKLAKRDGGARLTAKKRRSSWIPEVVDFARVEDPELRYKVTSGTYPQGTTELAATLDRLELPTDWGRDKVRAALKEAGEPARNNILTAAIRYRREAEFAASLEAGTGVGTGFPDTPGTGAGTGNPKTPSDQGWDRSGDRLGQVSSVSGDRSPSLQGDSPTPDPQCEICDGSRSGELLTVGAVSQHRRCATRGFLNAHEAQESDRG